MVWILLRRKIKFIAILFLLALLPLSASAQTLTEALQSYYRLDFKKMQSQLEAIVAKPQDHQDKEDLASAHVYLALLEWRFHQNHEKGRATLSKGLEGQKKRFELHTMMARLEWDIGNFSMAKKHAMHAQKAAKTGVDRKAAQILISKIAVQEFRHNLRNPERDDIDITALSPVLQSLRALVKSEPGHLKPSRLLLKAGLLADNGPAALEGLTSYYCLFLYESDTDLISGPLDVLREILLSWRGPQSDLKNRIRVASELAKLKMFDEAAIVTRDPRIKWKPPPELIKILHYADFIAQIKMLSDKYYRAAAVGESAFSKYQSKLQDAIIELWNTALFPDQQINSATFDQSKYVFMDRFIEKIRQDFGAYYRLSSSGQAHDLYFGHEITSKKMDIQQYGLSVPVRFILLDSMVSMGYRSWVWDFRSQVGGWARDNAIHILRPAFASQPLDAWDELHDPQKRAELEKKIIEDTQKDWDIAREDPFAFLPGLNARLRRDSKLEILERARQGSGGEKEIRQRFVSLHSQTVIESICLAHEGRHIIDHELLDIHNSPELEFRAKLSEVAFCEFPKLVLCHIVSPNIGSSSGHGLANLRIMRELVTWLENHAGEVPGLDSSKPLLPQLDLMSNDQLREAFRSMDPLAEKSK